MQTQPSFQLVFSRLQFVEDRVARRCYRYHRTILASSGGGRRAGVRLLVDHVAVSGAGDSISDLSIIDENLAQRRWIASGISDPRLPSAQVEEVAQAPIGAEGIGTDVVLVGKKERASPSQMLVEGGKAMAGSSAK